MEWGEGVVDELNGMFAFGIGDVWNEGLLLLRDRTGVNPLHYRTTPETPTADSPSDIRPHPAEPQARARRRAGGLAEVRVI